MIDKKKKRMAQQIHPRDFTDIWNKLNANNKSFVICFRMTPCPPCEILKPKYHQLCTKHREHETSVLFFWLDAPSMMEQNQLFVNLFVENAVGLATDPTDPKKHKAFSGSVPFIFCSFYDKATHTRHIGTSSTSNLGPLDAAISKFGYSK